MGVGNNLASYLPVPQTGSSMFRNTNYYSMGRYFYQRKLQAITLCEPELLRREKKA